ncbi:hypothetical protein UFOVP159_4 [uncultured Caudovirales phage]|uniref:Uncharacterized protein n=1 Tax=uncultured Caudovirales phage TaxID=2100421 RepID=A0A6J7WEU3_9CAUD|nr:hypothetical protein UFOVP159_4 [uncultured Caudovirales phage]
MTKEDRLISDQAKQLWDAKNRIKEMECALTDIQKLLICIGGPLNDNNLKYSNEQLSLFFKIQRIAESGLHD